MSDISVTLTSGPTIDVEIIGTGPTATLPTELKTNYDAAYSHSQSAHAPSDAQKNVQADWNETNVNSDAYIKNKPTIPSDVAVDSALSESSENPVQNNVIKAALDGKIDISTKGQPNGVASLDADGLIPSTQLPSTVAITNLTIDRPSTPVGTAENDKLIAFKTGGKNRWGIGSNATDEYGNDAGSNFVIYKYNDSGNNTGTPLWISRVTGVANFAQTPRVGSNNILHEGNLPTASAEVLGGIKVGENLKIDNGVLSVDTATLQTYVDTVILGGAS